MIRAAFFEDPDGGYAKFGNQRVFDRVWEKIVRFEKESGLCLDNGLTKEQYVDMFNSMKIRRTSTFPNCKTCTMVYIRYLIANNALPAGQEDILTSVTVNDLIITKGGRGVQYYKDLGMLQDAIQDSVKSSTSYDKTVYDPAVVALYLAWYGLTEQEIIDYPKENVLDDGIIIRGDKLQISPNILQIFIRLRDADGFQQQARGVIFHAYMYSEYLIRSERRSQLNIDLLRGSISRLNAICDKIYSLRYNVVYESGIFSRVYRMECDGFQFNLEDPKVASEMFCEDLSDTARRKARIRDYKLFKQLYY